MNVRLAIAGLLVIASTGGCGGMASPSENITEYAYGTIAKGGAGQVHFFTASKSGEHTLVVEKLTPPTSALFSMTWGQMSGNQCVPIQVTGAVTGVAGIVGRIDQGSYCVYLQDVGYFTTSEEYTLKLWHP